MTLRPRGAVHVLVAVLMAAATTTTCTTPGNAAASNQITVKIDTGYIDRTSTHNATQLQPSKQTVLLVDPHLSPGRKRHTTIWVDMASGVVADRALGFVQRHASAISRLILAFGCWKVADDGTVADPGDCHTPRVQAIQQEHGFELWAEVVVTPQSMLSGSWKPALARNGSLGGHMRTDWNWSGVVLDLEEMSDTPTCRQQHCGSRNAKHCSACVPAVSAQQYTAFLGEFSVALRALGLGLQICVGEIGPVSSMDTTGGLQRYLAAMEPVNGKIAIMAPFYYGTQDVKQKRMITYLQADVLRLNPMFGGTFNDTVPNGTAVVNTKLCKHRGAAPPCPYRQYHWNRSNYHNMLGWLAAKGVCETSIYPGPGGNVPAGAMGPHGIVPAPGRDWTELLAPWWMQELEWFRSLPGCK